MLLAVIVVLVPTETASGYDETVHSDVTQWAGGHFGLYYPNTEVATYLPQIAQGSLEEDKIDRVFGYPVGADPGYYRTIPHFWDADGGPTDPVTCYGCGVVGSHWPNAWQKISFMDVGDYPHVWPYMGLWDQALFYYRSGNKVSAYGLLGHIAHLIQDMSVPAHVHEDSHPTWDEYEERLDMDWDWVHPRLDQNELQKGLIDYSNIQIPGWTPSLSAIYYLLYTTNQRTDFFGSDDYSGDFWDPMGWIDPRYWPTEVGWYCVSGNMEDILWVCENCGKICMQEPSDLWCSCGGYVEWWFAPNYIAAHYTLVYAIRATATLFEVFLKEVDQGAPTTHIGIVNRYIAANNEVYISPDTTVTLTATDDTGVKVTGYRVVGGGYDSDWLVYRGPFTLNQVQAGLPDGPYTVLYHSADFADHLEADQSKDVYLTTRAEDYRVSLSTGGLYLGIQAAIDAAPNDSTIEVKPGVFQECINFNGKAITLRSEGGHEVTTINAARGLHAVTFANSEGATTILDGFTIMGGNASGVGFPDGCGAGILCSAAQPVIRNCIIAGNTAASEGGGVYFVTLSPVLQNCLIHHNSANNGGGLLSLYSQPTIANCTFTANKARGGPGGAIASFSSDGTNTPMLYNCILWGDSPSEIAFSTLAPFVYYSDVQAQAWPLAGNLSVDPKFADAANGDPTQWNYRLAADSPCIAVGGNTFVYEGEMDLDGYPRKLDGRCDGSSVVDMGAYEFSYAYQGDLDGNCTVGFADLAILAGTWMSEPADRTIDIAPELAGDGAINILDFAIFADHWLEGTGD